MYELREVPTHASTVRGTLNGDEQGVTGVRSGDHLIRLFPASLAILRLFYLDAFPGMRIAAASSADTPHAVRIGRAAMGLLEVLPGVTLRQVFAKGWPEGFGGNLQIGRSPPLSSDKAETHFPLLRGETGVSYMDMLFFDDCNWGDHCANVERECPGVTVQRTPRGLQLAEWEAGLASFRAKWTSIGKE